MSHIYKQVVARMQDHRCNDSIVENYIEKIQTDEPSHEQPG